MILSMSGQATTFLTTVAAGYIIGFIFDIFRLLRKIVPHTWLLTQIEDILYWIIASFGMFYVMLSQSDGEIRVYNVLGAALGIILYSYTFSKPFMAASTAIINFFKKVIALIVRIITAPFRLLYRLIKIPAKHVIEFLTKRWQNLKKLLRKWKNYAKMKGKGVIREFKIINKKV